MAYLNALSTEKHRKDLKLPMSYTALAQYLSVDRSAMTRELKNLEMEGIIEKKSKAKKYDEVDMAQMSLFDTVKDDDVLDELKNIDVGNLTPIDALNTIYRLQNKLKNRW